MLFYANRIIELNGTRDPAKLITALHYNPEKVWLTSIVEFRKLIAQHPEKVYLIQANNKLAFFTSMSNRNNIRYDFSTTLSSAPTSMVDQKKYPTLGNDIFDKSRDQGEGYNNDLTSLNCQQAIKQLGTFITSWQTEPANTGLSISLILPPVSYYLHKKFSIELYRNFTSACGIGKGFDWKDRRKTYHATTS